MSEHSEASLGGPGIMLKAWFWCALVAYVLVLPIGETIALRNLAFVALLGATTVLAWRSRQWPAFPLAAPWLLYALVALASLGYAADLAYSWRNIQAEIGYGILILIVATTWSRRCDTWPGVTLAVCAGCVVMLAATFWLALTDGISPGTPASLNAGVGNYSTYLVTILPLVASQGYAAWVGGRRLPAAAYALMVLAMLVALALTQNRQSFVALGGGLLVLALLVARGGGGKRRLLYVLAGFTLLAAVGAVSFVMRAPADIPLVQDSAPGVSQQGVSQQGVSQPAGAVEESLKGDQRWALWRFVLSDIAEHPWSGGGFGREAFHLMHRDFHQEHPLLWHAHNMVLNKGVQMGLPGMAAFLLLWAALARALAAFLDSPRGRPLAITGLIVLVCVFAKNMTDDFFVRDGALLFWLLMGTLLGTLKRIRGAERAAAAGGAGP